MNFIFFGAIRKSGPKLHLVRIPRRGPIGAIKHLKTECDELLNSPKDLEEYADAQFLIWDALRRAGFNLDDLMEALWDKLEKNKKRKWPPIDYTDDPHFHIKDKE